jgi:hypothetical protein
MTGLLRNIAKTGAQNWHHFVSKNRLQKICHAQCSPSRFAALLLTGMANPSNIYIKFLAARPSFSDSVASFAIPFLSISGPLMDSIWIGFGQFLDQFW